MPQAQFPASGSFQEVPGVLRADTDPTLNSLPVEKHRVLQSLLSSLVTLYKKNRRAFLLIVSQTNSGEVSCFGGGGWSGSIRLSLA